MRGASATSLATRATVGTHLTGFRGSGAGAPSHLNQRSPAGPGVRSASDAPIRWSRCEERQRRASRPGDRRHPPHRVSRLRRQSAFTPQPAASRHERPDELQICSSREPIAGARGTWCDGVSHPPQSSLAFPRSLSHAPRPASRPPHHPGLLAAGGARRRSRWWRARPRRRDSWTVPRRGLGHDQAGTATATATACRSTAPRAPPGRAWRYRADRRLLLPGHHVGHGHRPGHGADHRRHQRRPRRRGPPGPHPARHRRRRAASRCPTTAPPAGASPSPATAQPVSPTSPAAGTASRDARRARASSPPAASRSRWSRRAATGAYRGRLRAPRRPPGPAARDTVNDADPGELPQGRRAARDAGAVEPRGGPRPGRRGAHLRGVRARRTRARRHYQLCDTPRCQVYGGYAAEHPASNAAVDATRAAGPADAAASRRSRSSRRARGGWTSAGSVPYLPARKPTRTTAGRATRSTPGRATSPTRASSAPGRRSAT